MSASSTLERNIESSTSGIERVSTQSGNVVEVVAKRKSTGERVPGSPGWSLVLNGSLQASEDLAIEGTVEGNIDLQGRILTINMTGVVNGNIYADTVVVHGTVRGNICGSDHIDLRRTGLVVGDLIASRIVITDGAYFKGSIDIRRRKDIEEAKDDLTAMQVQPTAFSERLIARFHELVDKKLALDITGEEFQELKSIERLMDEAEQKLTGINEAASMNSHLQMTNKLSELIDELRSFSPSRRPK